MSIKEKMLNKIADFMYKHKTADMDKIKSCNISAKVKGAVIGINGKYIKDIPKKEEHGLIDVDKLLIQEIKNNDMQNIVFCDNGRIVCLTNQLGASYVETRHECFDLANESVYIMCDSKKSYNAFKEYIQQSSKWHNYIDYKNEIPNQTAFEKLFHINSKPQEKEPQVEEKESQVEKKEPQVEKKEPRVEEKESQAEEKEPRVEEKIDSKTQETLSERNGNIIQLDGIISNKGKTFLKRDNKQAKYIEVTQEDIYNGKKQSYNLTISLEDSVLSDYGNRIQVGDKVRVTGKVINYVDKNNQPQSIVNSFDFEILEKANQKNVEVEATR